MQKEKAKKKKKKPGREQQVYFSHNFKMYISGKEETLTSKSFKAILKHEKWSNKTHLKTNELNRNNEKLLCNESYLLFTLIDGNFH